MAEQHVRAYTVRLRGADGTCTGDRTEHGDAWEPGKDAVCALAMLIRERKRREEVMIDKNK